MIAMSGEGHTPREGKGQPPYPYKSRDDLAAIRDAVNGDIKKLEAVVWGGSRSEATQSWPVYAQDRRDSILSGAPTFVEIGTPDRTTVAYYVNGKKIATIHDIGMGGCGVDMEPDFADGEATVGTPYVLLEAVWLLESYALDRGLITDRQLDIDL